MKYKSIRFLDNVNISRTRAKATARAMATAMATVRARRTRARAKDRARARDGRTDGAIYLAICATPLHSAVLALSLNLFCRMTVFCHAGLQLLALNYCCRI